MHTGFIPRSPSPKYQLEESKASLEDYGRRGREYSEDRPPSKPAALRSRSPSPPRGDKQKSRRWRNRRSKNEKKYGKYREKERQGKSGHRSHDIWKPGQSEGSPPASRGRDYSPPESSPRRRSYSPSPRRDRPSTAGSAHGYYEQIQYGYDRSEPLPLTSQPSIPSRSPHRRSSADSRFRPLEYEIHPPEEAGRRYEDHPIHPAQDYGRGEHGQSEERRPTRQRGGDYDRDEWERTHPPEPPERSFFFFHHLIVDTIKLDRQRNLDIIPKILSLPDQVTRLNILLLLTHDTSIPDIPKRCLMRRLPKDHGPNTMANTDNHIPLNTSHPTLHNAIRRNTMNNDTMECTETTDKVTPTIEQSHPNLCINHTPLNLSPSPIRMALSLTFLETLHPLQHR